MTSFSFKVLFASTLCTSLVTSFVHPAPFASQRTSNQYSTAVLGDESYLSTKLLAKNDDEEQNVRVSVVEDVDSITLTAIGFALIAFNFLVLANLGDGGISGVLATIINTMKQ